MYRQMADIVLLDTGVRQYDGVGTVVIPGPRMRNPESSRKEPPFGRLLNYWILACASMTELLPV